MKTAVRADIEKLPERLQIKSSFSESFLASGYFLETRLKGDPLLFTPCANSNGFCRCFAFQIGKIHYHHCTVRNFQFRKFLPVCSNGDPADFNETILQVFVLRAFFLIPRIRTIKLLQKRDIRPGGLRQLDTFLENIGTDIIAVPVGFRLHPVRKRE